MRNQQNIHEAWSSQDTFTSEENSSNSDSSNSDSLNSDSLNNSGEGSEQYEVILTTVQRPVIARICDILEEKEVPVMIQHVEVMTYNDQDQAQNSAGYRVLVPSHFLQTAASAVGSFGVHEQEFLAH